MPAGVEKGLLVEKVLAGVCGKSKLREERYQLPSVLPPLA